MSDNKATLKKLKGVKDLGKHQDATFTIDEMLKLIDDARMGRFPSWYTGEKQRRKEEFVDAVVDSKLPEIPSSEGD